MTLTTLFITLMSIVGAFLLISLIVLIIAKNKKPKVVETPANTNGTKIKYGYADKGYWTMKK